MKGNIRILESEKEVDYSRNVGTTGEKQYTMDAIKLAIKPSISIRIM